LRDPHGVPEIPLKPEKTDASLAPVPGSTYTLLCPGCAAEHKLLTGEFDDGKLLEQRVCPQCQLIVSDFSYGDEDPDRCPNARASW
jgi:hypothetical protein